VQGREQRRQGRSEATHQRRRVVQDDVGQAPRKERVRPLLTALGGQGIFDFGEELGAAHLVKLLGNVLIIAAGHSLREVLTVAERHGVAPTAVVDMLTHTLFPAPIYQSYGRRIAERHARFSQRAIPLKDVGLFTDSAQQVGLSTPVAHQLYALVRIEGEPA